MSGFRDITDRIKMWLMVNGVWLLYHILGLIYQIETHGEEHISELDKSGETYILSLWHGKMLVPGYHRRGEGICVMVSRSRDGELISRTINKLGYTTVRGSSSRGGAEALKSLVKQITKNRRIGAMIPDGPRGPAKVLKKGVAAAASMSGVPVVPMTFASASCWRAGSWDGMCVPKPFSRNVVIYGKPLRAESKGEDDVKRFTRRIQQGMDEIEAFAEGYFA